MKTYLFFIVLFFLSHYQMFSQTYENEQNPDSVSGDQIVIDNTNVSPEVLSDLGFSTTTSVSPESVVGSLVTIQQIGDFNSSSININAQSSDIGVVQVGNENDTLLDYNVQSVFTRVLQQGDSNRVTDIVSGINVKTSLELSQQGDNLTFERYGVNNLTNSLQFHQTEASPAIIVRSYQ